MPWMPELPLELVLFRCFLMAGEGDGEAYRNSGPSLDRMTKESRFIKVTTPWESMNQELDIECALLDTIISKWSSKQAKVFIETWKGKTQKQMAPELSIS